MIKNCQHVKNDTNNFCVLFGKRRDRRNKNHGTSLPVSLLRRAERGSIEPWSRDVCKWNADYLNYNRPLHDNNWSFYHIVIFNTHAISSTRWPRALNCQLNYPFKTLTQLYNVIVKLTAVLMSLCCSFECWKLKVVFQTKCLNNDILSCNNMQNCIL